MARTLCPSTETIIPREFSAMATLLPSLIKETLRLLDALPPEEPDERELVEDLPLNDSDKRELVDVFPLAKSDERERFCLGDT